MEARPARTGAFALVRPADTGPLGWPRLRPRNIGFALLVGVAVGAWWSGSWSGTLLARPLRRTAAAARRAARRAAGRAGAGRAGRAEIAEVAGAVNELADALARSEERQREFLLSVSHELRTPLTAVRGFAESLADGVVTGDEVARRPAG